MHFVAKLIKIIIEGKTQAFWCILLHDFAIYWLCNFTYKMMNLTLLTFAKVIIRLVCMKLLNLIFKHTVVSTFCSLVDALKYFIPIQTRIPLFRLLSCCSQHHQWFSTNFYFYKMYNPSLSCVHPVSDFFYTFCDVELERKLVLNA